MPYLDNYWSNSFGPKCDPLVFKVPHLPIYFGNLIFFISHTISNFQKCWSLTMTTLTLVTSNFDYKYEIYSMPYCSCAYALKNAVQPQNQPLWNGSKPPTLCWSYIMVIIMKHIIVGYTPTKSVISHSSWPSSFCIC